MLRKLVYLTVFVLVLSLIAKASVAGSLLVDLDTNDLPLGTLTIWANEGTLSGSLRSGVSGRPTVGTVAGRKAVTLDGTKWLKSTFPAPAGITGNSDFSVAVWAYNPSIAGEECMVQWARRGTSPRCAQLNYGTSRDFGAVTHWSNPDMGYDGGVPGAGTWHHIAVTYEGGTNGTEKVYVDGKLNATEDKTLDLWPGDPIRLGCADNEHYFSGSLAAVTIYDHALSQQEVGYLAGKTGKKPGPALVDLDARHLPAGPLKTWTNKGTLGGSLDVESSSPTVQMAAGRKAITFDTNKWLKSTFTAPPGITGKNAFSLIVLAYNPAISNDIETMVSWAPRPGAGYIQFGYGSAARKLAFVAAGTRAAYDNKVPPAKQWHYIAYTYAGGDNGAFKIYVDGKLNAQHTLSLNTKADEVICLGGGWDTRRDTAFSPFSGSLAAVKIYDYALSQREVRESIGLFTAFNPAPADGQTADGLKVTLHWDQGTEDAKSYNVYFSTNKSDVENAGEKAYKGSQSADTNDYGPVQLTLGQTYYWRIDQLDKAGVPRWRGDVWHFMAETGQAENPIPRNKIAAVNVQTKELTWTPGKYVVSQNVYFGTSFDDANIGQTPYITGLVGNASKCAVPVLPLEHGRTYYWRVDQINGALPTSKGYVWSFRTADRLVYNDITFFASSDSHYGVSDTIVSSNRATIDVMNSIPGTEYPASVGGGIVYTPRGLILTGDLTNSGAASEWEQFTTDYGVNGEGYVIYPVYEIAGNHDAGPGGPVRQGIRKRNTQRTGLTSVSSTGLHYSWDWDDVHFVNLGIFPGNVTREDTRGDPEYSLDFLIKDLAENVGESGRPVIVSHHYGHDGWGLSWWESQEMQDTFYDAIKNHNVIGILHGHSHAARIYTWRGIDVYNVASTQRDPEVGEYFVFHITQNEMTVAHRYSDHWGINTKKAITGMSAKESVRGVKAEVTR